MLCVWILCQARGTEASSAPHCLAILGKRSKLGFLHAPGSLSGNAVLKQAPHYAAWTIRSKVIPLTFQCMVGSVVGTRRWTVQRSYAKVVCPCAVGRGTLVHEQTSVHAAGPAGGVHEISKASLAAAVKIGTMKQSSQWKCPFALRRGLAPSSLSSSATLVCRTELLDAEVCQNLHRSRCSPSPP